MELRVHRVSFYNPQPQAVRCLSYDKTNSRLALSRSDSSLEIWDLKENPYMEKASPGSSDVSIETLSWCDGRLFSAGLYGQITEHDLTSLLPKYQLVITSGCSIWCMSANSSKCLAIGNEDGHVVLHELSSEGLDYIKKFDKQEGSILCLDWHIDGQVIVTGSTDAIRVWNVSTGHVINRILLARATKNTPTVVWCVAITRDMTIISGDSCGKTSFWDGNTGTLLSATGSKTEDILALAVSEEEDVIYTSGVDPTITMYMKSQANGKWMKSIQRVVHTHDVRALQIAGNFLASGGDDCNLVFTKYPPKTTIKYFPFCQKSYTMTISEPPSILLQYPDSIEIWSLVKSATTNENGRPINSLRIKPKKNENIICSSLSSDGKWLAYSTQLQIRLFFLSFDKEKPTPVIHKVPLPNEVQSTASLLLFTSEPSNLIVYGHRKISIVKCDITQPTLQAIIEEDSDSGGEIHLMDLSSDNIYLACGSHNGSIIVYNLNTLRIFCKLPHYKCQPTSLKFDPAGENLIVVYSDRKVIEYNFQKLAYSSWSKQQALLDFQTASYHPITSICFLSGKLLLQDESAMYIFDRTEERKLEKKRIKRTEDTFDAVEEGAFKTVDKYEHISSIHSCGNDLVVVHHSSNRILDCLPPPVWKKKYGT